MPGSLSPPMHRRADADVVIDLTDPAAPRMLRGDVAVPARAPTRRAVEMGRLALALLLAAAFTVIDAVATYAWLRAGHDEWNPLLRRLIEAIGAGPAMGVRGILGLSLLAALVPLLTRSRTARRGLLGVTAVLGGVSAYHLYGLVAHVLLR